MNLRNFFAELKRRNVYKVAIRVRGHGMVVDHVATLTTL
jgi:hypothetical protein